ncbi:MAG: helix-turn-helix domain-containing protein [Balneolaceae bacterium]|nr:helix-turn-helix domain-containing protein [Balneolaceae bacterium]
MITVPQAFLEDTDTLKILRDGLNCMIDKKAKAPNPNNDRYITAHALTIVQSGSLSITKNDGYSETVNQGEMVFLPKGLYMVSDIIPKNKPFRATVYFFEEKLIHNFINSFEYLIKNRPKIEKFWIVSQMNSVKVFNDHLLELYGNHNPANNRLTKNKLQELLHLVATSDEGPTFLGLLNHLKNRGKVNISQFMEQNFDKPLNIEDYANLTGRSPSTFYRDFKRKFGVSPQKWLIQKRMEKAKVHLSSNHEKTVTEVAFNSGYENISHFIKTFKKHFGISPKQYQMRVRESMSV